MGQHSDVDTGESEWEAAEVCLPHTHTDMMQRGRETD